MSQQRKCSQQMTLAAKPSRRIVLPIGRNQYQEVVQDAGVFRQFLDTDVEQYPELFPDEMRDGYSLHNLLMSRKLPELCIRRIRLNRSGALYGVVPSFVLALQGGLYGGG
jgi:hypothetical protein